MSVLVIDCGTSQVRAGVVREDGSVDHVQRRPVPPSSPAPGLVEFDAAAMAAAALDAAAASLADAGPVAAVGVTNQRASTVLWHRETGQPVGPALGWQDLRTAGRCLMLRREGVRLQPNQSATKLSLLLEQADRARAEHLLFGTVDTWIAWNLSRGSVHVTDPSNAGVTGLLLPDASGWDDAVLSALGIPHAVLPALVDSTGVVGDATALAGSPPIAGIAGDQQASLVGQGCIRRGLAKVTFGSGGMLDLCLGATRPAFAIRGEAGCFPIVAWQEAGRRTWGLEAVMLSAGSCVEWLRDDLGMIAALEESDALAASVSDSAGVYFVPALLGLGAPIWDFGARGTLLGLTRGSTRAHVVRAVLDGIAQRGADLLEAAETDSGLSVETICLDGGMGANATFVQALADATRRDVAVSSVLEATTLGAAYLAGCAVGVWSNLAEATSSARASRTVQPRRRFDRARWLDMRARAERTVPQMSALEF